MRFADPSKMNEYLNSLNSPSSNDIKTDVKNIKTQNMVQSENNSFAHKINSIFKPTGIIVNTSSESKGGLTLLILLAFCIYGMWSLGKKIFSSNK